MAAIRAFQREDIPAVVALRRSTFRHSERPDPADLAAYIESIFFRSPWRDPSLPSLVYVDDFGRPVGFLGVVTRPISFRGQTLRMTVTTQLMVDPKHRGTPALELVRAVIGGPQDLTYADLSTDVARRVWEMMGGDVIQVPSLSWEQPLRPVRFYGGRLGRGRAAQAARMVLRPLSWVLDAHAPKWLHADGLRPDTLTATAIVERLPHLMRDVALWPRYDPAGLEWLLTQVAARRGLGELVGTALRNANDTIIGWYLYYADRPGVGQVVQVAATPGHYRDIVLAMLHDAWERGLTALSGRLDPQLVPALNESDGLVVKPGPWVLAHSRHPEVANAIRQGDAFLSRLEGEWWMSF